MGRSDEPAAMLTPLQLPGAAELLVIVLIFLILLAIPAGLVLLGVHLLRRRGSRIDELEARVEELESTDD